MCHLGSSRDGRLTLAAKMEFGWFRLTHQYWKYWLFVVLAITGGIGVPSLKSATGQTWRMTEGAAPTQPAAAEVLGRYACWSSSRAEEWVWCTWLMIQN